MIRQSVLAVPLALSLAAPAWAQSATGAYLSAEAARRAGDYESAGDYYLRVIEAGPDTVETRALALVSLGADGRFDEAEDLAARIAPDEDAAAFANAILLTQAARAGRWADAAALVGDDAAAIGVHLDLARAWVAFGGGDMAVATTILQTPSTFSEVTNLNRYHLALIHAAGGDYGEAEAILSGERFGPLNLSARGVIAHAHVLAQLDRPDDALDLLDAAVGISPDPALPAMRARIEAGGTGADLVVGSAAQGLAEVFYLVADFLLGQNVDAAATLTYAWGAVHLWPDFAEARLFTADVLSREGRHARAVEVYETVASESPRIVAADIGRADALFDLGRTDRAIEAIRATARAHPDDVRVRIMLADLLYRDERWAEAARAYGEAIPLYEDAGDSLWILHFRRAVALDNSDDWEGAEAQLRRALELNPEEPTVLNYLGYAMVEQRRNLDEALAMIERAVEQRPDSGFITDSLAWVYYRLGRFEDAVAPMERAVELEPADPILNDHLGDVYWMVGRRREAEFQWERALSFDPAPEDAARIRRKLEVGLDTVLAEEDARGVTQ